MFEHLRVPIEQIDEVMLGWAFLIPLITAAASAVASHYAKKKSEKAAAKTSYSRDQWNYEAQVRPEMEKRNRSENSRNALMASLAKGMGLEGLYGDAQVQAWSTPLKTPDYLSYDAGYKPEDGAFGYINNAGQAAAKTYIDYYGGGAPYKGPSAGAPGSRQAGPPDYLQNDWAGG